MPRTAKFDRDLVLERAMQTFWNQGYCATSLTNLTETTELNPGSIYAAFKSKQGLFLATLDHYGRRSVEEITHTLSTAETPMTGLRKLFNQLAGTANNTGPGRSCFLVNTVLEVTRHDPQVRESINRYFDIIESKIFHTLEAAQSSGELSNAKNPAAMATFIMTTIWGIRVLLVTGADQVRVDAVIQQLFDLLE
ncbi:MAG: TetR/AcrR family transcriptional regulator [Candidatus Thiodiazotropha sp. (ex Monitilora ramsayi)]|nr:TetR/AcrR family transcriptional regulator [Candidatus Thiodiazotropha sp. (ex Monitilora ramsayi)]